MHNAIDTARFAFDPAKRETVRADLDLGDRLVVAHIGRFVYSKNHMFLIEIFHAIRKIRSDAVLLLIGDGELREKTEARVHELDLDDAVRFMGIRDDIPDLMQAMDVFLLPSFYEGLGMVLIEAQAAGLPCVVSDKVPEEAFISHLVKALPLDHSAELWAPVVSQSVIIDRPNTSQIVSASGYSIQEEARKLQEYYLQRYAELK